MNKEHIDITIDHDLKERAKQKGINISAVANVAVAQKLGEIKIEQGKLYPFDFCDEHIPEDIKNTLFGCVAIRAARCAKCDNIWFVNDQYNRMNPFICKHCWNSIKPEERDKIVKKLK